MRVHRNWLPKLDSYPEFLRCGGFIPVQIGTHMDKTLIDLLSEMETGGYDSAQQCLNAMIFKELFEGKNLVWGVGNAPLSC